MSLRARIGSLFGSRGNAAPDSDRDPVAALDAQYVTVVGALEDVRGAIASVLVNERLLERERARATGETGDRLTTEVTALRAQRETLERTATGISTRLSEMRTQKTALGAQAAAFRASLRAETATARVAENAYDVAELVDAARSQAFEIAAFARELAERESELASPGQRDWQPDPPGAHDSGE